MPVKQFTRRVQKAGPSSLAVILPTEWVKGVRIKSGDEISVMWEDDNSLKVCMPLRGVEAMPEACAISGDLVGGARSLVRWIIAMYIAGRDQIVITSQKGLSEEFLSEVENGVKRLNGIDVITKTPFKVVIQSFLDPMKYSPSGLLRRLYQLTRECLSYPIASLSSGNRDIAERVRLTEEEVDRLYWLTLRQLLLCSERVDLAKKLSLEPRHMVGNRLIAKVFEKTADESECMANQVLTILDRGHTPSHDLIQSIVGLGKLVQGTYDSAVKAFFTEDLQRADSAIEDSRSAVTGLSKAEADLGRQLHTGEVPELVDRGSWAITIVALREMLQHLSRVARLGSTISEVALNRTFEKCVWCVPVTPVGDQMAASAEP